MNQTGFYSPGANCPGHKFVKTDEVSENDSHIEYYECSICGETETRVKL